MNDVTIDEAISFCEEKASNIKLKAEPQVFIQIAAWLEELKAYRETNLNPSMIKDLVRSEKKAHRIALENAEKIDSYVDEFEKNIRNNAIDDFVKEICKMIVKSENNGNYRFYAVEIKQTIADLAEQLKVGVKDE